MRKIKSVIIGIFIMQFLSVIFRHEFVIGGEIFIPVIVFFMSKVIQEIAKIFKI